MPERRNAAADCGSSCVALLVRFNGFVEILVLLVRAAEIDIRRRLFLVANRYPRSSEYFSIAVLKLRLSVAATASRYMRLGVGQRRAIREQRHRLQQCLPGSVGEFELRVRFGPSCVRQGERVVDLERAIQRLARLKVRPLADGAGPAVVPDDGLGRRLVAAAPKTETERTTPPAMWQRRLWRPAP